MKKFVVEYGLTYDHTVRVGVSAESREDAEAKAEAAFNAGTIWDDTPNMPLLYDAYDEQDDNTLEFFAVEAGDAFPKVDESVVRERGRQKAIDAAKLLVAAYARGAANGGSIDWSDIDAAHEVAVAALRDLNIDREPQAAATELSAKAN